MLKLKINEVKVLMAKNQDNQRTLATRLGINEAYLSQIMKGHKTPSLQLANKIAKLYQVNVMKIIEL